VGTFREAMAQALQHPKCLGWMFSEFNILMHFAWHHPHWRQRYNFQAIPGAQPWHKPQPFLAEHIVLAGSFHHSACWGMSESPPTETLLYPLNMDYEFKGGRFNHLGAHGWGQMPVLYDVLYKATKTAMWKDYLQHNYSAAMARGPEFPSRVKLNPAAYDNWEKCFGLFGKPPWRTEASSATIQSGDTVFLRTHTGKHIHVGEGATKLPALRWADHGKLQEMTIEKDGGGAISNGDIIYVRTHSQRYLDVDGDGTVQCRWDRHLGHSMLQEIGIERVDAGGGAITPGDKVYLRMESGSYLDVGREGEEFRARWSDHEGEHSKLQTLVIERDS